MRDYSMSELPLQSADGRNETNKSYSSSTSLKYLVILLIGKLFKALGIFLVYDLLKRIHLIQLLFFSLAVASVFYVLLQRPFSSGGGNKRLSKFQYVRLFKYSLVHTSVELMWLFGLTLCGPFRTTLIFEQSPFVIICALKAFFLSQTNPARTRGVLVLLFATLILLAFDYDHISGRASNDLSDSQNNNPHGIFSHIFSFFTSWLDISDHKGGVLLLAIALFIQIGFDHSSFSRVLLTDVGGPKRLKALTTVLSTLLIAPWAIFNIFSHVANPSHDLADGMVQGEAHSWIYYVLPVCFVALFMYVVDFYLDVLVVQKTDSIYATKFGSIFVFTWAGALSLVWNHPHVVVVIDRIKTVIENEHSLSTGVLIAYVLFCIATNMLSKPLAKHRGSFIGYSQIGSPLYSLTGEAHKTSSSMMVVLKNMLREVVTHQDSKRIFYFLCLNLAFTFVEISYGVLSNSLGLLSDGIHMLFDCLALVMGLVAAVISQWKPTRVYSYGFARVEILAGFINGLFLVVISVFIFIEAIERLIEPPEIKSGKILYVSVIGLCVNLFGIFAFSHAHSHMGGSHTHSHSHSHQHNHSHSHDHNHSHGSGGSDHNHSHSSQCSSSSHAADSDENDNMRAVFLHVLADTLGSVGVIISSLLIQQFGWYLADPICSLCISAMIFVSVIPLLKHSSGLLLLKMPASENGRLYRKLLNRILSIDGVISYRDERLWQLSSSSYISTLHVQISQTAYEQLISSQIQSILKEMKLSYLTVQLEKATFFQHLSGLGASMGQIDESKSVFRSQNSSLVADAISLNVEKYV